MKKQLKNEMTNKRAAYKRLGDYIEQVNLRNTELRVDYLVGLTINKKFISSVANIIGTDLSNYKLIKKNQFACSLMQVSRDGKIPIARFEGEIGIMSPAYPIFKIIDEKTLMPEYLMMWFERDEFDREAAYYAVGGVRGTLTWEDFCDMKLPLPPISEQHKIVAEYQTIENKIKVNQQICQKLETTAQAIYKEWFVEFNFPNEEGKPYKDSGGKMVWNDELDKEVPEGWDVSSLLFLTKDMIGGDWGKENSIANYKSKVRCIRGTDIPNLNNVNKELLPTRYILEKNLLNRKLEKGNIVIELSGGSPVQSTGRTILITENLLNFIKSDLICSNFCRVIKIKSDFEYIYNLTLLFNYNNGLFFTYENSSHGVKNLAINDLLEDLKVAYNKDVIMLLNNEIIKIDTLKFKISNQNHYLNELKSVLLARMVK